MKTKIVPGVQVTITKGHENWNSNMNKYVGQVHRIRSVRKGSTGYTEVVFDFHESSEIHQYFWVYEQGHFAVHYPESSTKMPFKRKLKLKLN